jgi:putative membrane protein
MGWMGFGWIFGVALVALVVWALVRTGGAPGNTRESPEQILKRRYASGEIDRETYQRMLSDLKG